MSSAAESTAWGRELTSLLDVDMGNAAAEDANGFSYDVSSDDAVPATHGGDWRFQLSEFAKGAGEMSLEFGRGLRDVVNQSLLREDSVLVRKFKEPCEKIGRRLKFLNDYLPEDRDPLHAWTLIACVWFFALAALLVNTAQNTTPMVTKMTIHPPNATLIQLPDGRQLAYLENGVSPDQARYTLIVPHSFLSSRLAGIPGIKSSLLEEFGVRVVTYDLPGFGESDPHPGRTLETSAVDLLHLSVAVNINGRFWIVGYSSGSIHAWGALRYIPHKIEGAIMVAPMVNPYEPKLTKKERREIWERWSARRKLMYFLARKFPGFLRFFYSRSFLSGNHDHVEKWLHFSPGMKDRSVIENPGFEELWRRDVEESVRQRNAESFVEEASLQVSDWGFGIEDIKVKHENRRSGILGWFKSVMYGPDEEKVTGFLGPINIWQGLEDGIVPTAMSEFVERVLPDVAVHKLPYEGHFSYFYLCDECHRRIFSAAFGEPRGPLLETIPIQEGEDDSETIEKDDDGE